jgi:NAD(P)-dependent dehydrogenase (short-subunit alcohol dehydrogenase family)
VTDLAGRVALVTGASHGTGVDIARALAAAGARVAVHYRTDRAAAAALAASLRDGGAGAAEIFGADVARSDDVRRLVAEVEARLGPPRWWSTTRAHSTTRGSVSWPRRTGTT